MLANPANIEPPVKARQRGWTILKPRCLAAHSPLTTLRFVTEAGGIALIRYDSAIPSLELAERIRKRQSTLVVPGSHVGLEGYLRVWLGGREEFLREGLRRIGVELRAVLLG